MTAPQSAMQWEALASDCERAAALLSAGLPSSVVRSVAFVGSLADEDRVTPTRTSMSHDRDLVGAAWAASVEIGAPLSITLTLLAQMYRGLAGIEREVESAVAGPRLATRVMLTLPAISVVLAGGLGMNILNFFFGNAFGTVCLLSGALLIWTGWWWSRRLVSRLATKDVPRGIEASVVVAGLRVGVGVQTTMATLARHLGAMTPTNRLENMDELAALSSTWGAPLADLVVAHAQQSRDAALAHMRKQCAELAERLLIPLGSCALPAFILWGVVPIVFELITTSGIAVFPGAG